jgi:O-antigen/teichoic acid export membrane protein
MITKFGGAAYTAIFDFIIKLLSISRNLIIAANQTIVPQLTIYTGLKKVTTLKTLYKANFKTVLFLSILLFLTPLAFSDALSIFFLNEKSNLFCFILLNVSLGLLINAFALPAHFHFLGIGQIRWNVLNNILTATLMLVSAPLLGYFFQAKYIVLSWSISTMAGPILLMYVMHKQYKLSLHIFYSWHNLLLIISIIIAIIVNKFVANGILSTNQVYINVAVSLIVYLAIVVLPIKSHPIVIKFLQKHFNQNK